MIAIWAKFSIMLPRVIASFNIVRAKHNPCHKAGVNSRFCLWFGVI